MVSWFDACGALARPRSAEVEVLATTRLASEFEFQEEHLSKVLPCAAPTPLARTCLHIDRFVKQYISVLHSKLNIMLLTCMR